VKRTDFSYHLPPDLIAQEPRERGRSRMMVVTPPDGIEHDSFANFAARLAPEDVVVVNDTRVIPARLFARPLRGMSRPVEVLLVRALSERTWEVWAKPAKRIRIGDELMFSDRLTATVLEKEPIVIQFEGDLGEIERVGVMPLPPYIARPEPRESDRESYQTVYAAARGAIAAPTAGLHFTREMLEAIAKTNEIVRITLHVGIGTFEPVKVDDLSQHVMHSERYEISEEAAKKLNASTSIVAIGTTTLRALESAGPPFKAGAAETDIFITPGYRFKAVDRLLTNFHLPESTLLMLVSAFAGAETIRRAYAEAISHRYFFYSYGDCMFITRRVNR
jgi:S-adenosylmethionine:tRNA ribosyltransferase-isomerase